MTFPAYWWLLPDSALPDGPCGLTDTWGEAVAGAALGIVLAPPVAWIGAGLARGQARVARFLLGPSERSQLEHRVGELTRTRAAAVDAQTSELRRIERDLHDGAQARILPVTMDLGRAREKLYTDRWPACPRRVRGRLAKLALSPADGNHRRVLAVLAYLRSS